MKHLITLLSFGLVAGSFGFGLDAQAAGCAVTTNVTASPLSIDYDPFLAATQRSSAFSITLTPPTAVAGQPRVRSIDYQFLDTDSPSQPQIGAQGALVEIVRAGRSILHARGNTDFTDPNGYNSVNIPNGSNSGTGPVGVMIADGRQDLAAGTQSENFDLGYRCNFSDGSTTDGIIPVVLTATVSTQFLVRATVVGGGSSKTLTIEPGTRSASGGMSVRSTGPFSISLASINNLTLRPEGAMPNAVLPANQTLPYVVRVGGDVMEPTSPPKMCARSGLGGSVIRVNTRIAGGVDVDEVRAGTYSDVLTVTVTPEVNGAGTGVNCSQNLG
jgi:hypothetical protein